MTNHVRRYLAKIGRRGGQAGTGAAKARPLTARKAALARWAKYREGKA